MKPRLTERQNEALDVIRSYVRRHRKPPTLKEIGEALGIASSNGVYKLLQALERKGYVEREAHAARGLRLVEEEADPFGLDESAPTLPLVSRTRSDRPEHLRRRPSAYLTVDPYLLQGADEERCLLARAGDDGMNGEGIRKGDFLVIEEVPYEELRNGETAAFLVRETLQVRRFHFVNGRLHLRPADRTYTEETYVPADPACHVVGRVRALLRRL